MKKQTLKTRKAVKHINIFIIICSSNLISDGIKTVSQVLHKNHFVSESVSGGGLWRFRPSYRFKVLKESCKRKNIQTDLSEINLKCLSSLKILIQSVWSADPVLYSIRPDPGNNAAFTAH